MCSLCMLHARAGSGRAVSTWTAKSAAAVSHWWTDERSHGHGRRLAYGAVGDVRPYPRAPRGLRMRRDVSLALEARCLSQQARRDDTQAVSPVLDGVRAHGAAQAEAMKKRWYENDWFWVVAIPTAFIALIFAFAMLLAVLE